MKFPSVDEVGLGSGDYEVVPLNAREKKLLRAPGAIHLHRTLLELIESVEPIVERSVRRDSLNWTGGSPYKVTYVYGWQSYPDTFFARFEYPVCLLAGSAMVTSPKTELVDKASPLSHYFFGRLGALDRELALKVLSTVQVRIEILAAKLERRSLADVQSQSFKEYLSSWVQRNMLVELRSDLHPLLEKYPAQALIEEINALVVADLHDE